MSTNKVSIVILNYNTKALLDQFLPGVLETNYTGFEVVVADNASQDGSADLVRSKYPEVKLIQLDQNYGFAGGYNKALAQLNTPYWVLLNSDVEVDPNWLEPLMQKMESDNNIGAVQPKILDYENRNMLEYAGASGGFIDKYAYPFCRGRIFNELEADNGQYNEERKVFWATGAALLVRAEYYTSLGGLDEDFFAHMEEIDLCWRLKNAGKEVWVCPDAHVYHMGGGTLSSLSSRKTFLNFRNNLALITKNLPFGQWLRVFSVRLILDGIAGCKFLMDGKPSHTLAIVKAHWSFFIRFGFWWNKRKKAPAPISFRNHDGMFDLSLIYQHYAKGVRHFSELDSTDSLT
ncbi:MAG: glycosyltransferase family 2 protein [Bacteroidia bacterium]|nr:glycosyltransferase family 2 protein [Bacteroidia bacterium]